MNDWIHPQEYEKQLKVLALRLQAGLTIIEDTIAALEDLAPQVYNVDVIEDGKD